mmetsp:Transcript_37044/g.90043  ORF Transcript_37044/g.90043 Transcript_37044/m.90043 type:complete len:189 (+) Transcript_37044:110-676(+)
MMNPQFTIIFFCLLIGVANADEHCFTDDDDELQKAVAQFVQDGCTDDYDCKSAVAGKYGHPIGTWCVNGVEEMNYVFLNAHSFNDNISAWDTSNVKSIQGMFSGASSFNQDLSSWDVSRVENMAGIFEGARSFNQDLSSWDTSKVLDMADAFKDAYAFNGNVSVWNVSAVVSIIFQPRLVALGCFQCY